MGDVVRQLLLVLTTILGNTSAILGHPATSALLQLESKIPLGAVSGRIDHMAIDLERRRLFVAELGNDSVGVVDLNTQNVIHRISGLKEPQGVAYVNDLLYVANGGTGLCVSLRRLLILRQGGSIWARTLITFVSIGQRTAFL